MSIIAHFQYSSKEKLRIVNMYRNGRFSISSICSRYRISKATLMNMPDNDDFQYNYLYCCHKLKIFRNL